MSQEIVPQDRTPTGSEESTTRSRAVPTWTVLLTGRPDGQGAKTIVVVAAGLFAAMLVALLLLAVGAEGLASVIAFAVMGAVVIVLPIIVKSTFMEPNSWLLITVVVMGPVAIASISISTGNVAFWAVASGVLALLYLTSRAKAIKAGESGPLKSKIIRAAQERLIELGLIGNHRTGFYDDATFEAVRQFQNLNGLTPNGKLNRKTWNELIA